MGLTLPLPVQSKLYLVGLLWLLMGSLSATANGMTGDPLALYGDQITFDVFRKGERIGQHSVSFSRSSDSKLSVAAKFNLRITFLTIPFYEFQYRSLALWKDGRLKALDSYIDDDGEKSTVRASSSDGTMTIKRSNSILKLSGSLFPTNHWNDGVLSQNRVLNTLDGKISQVRITPEGSERIRAEGVWIEATRYQYSGDIETTVWYDEAGRWVKMRFPAKDGSIIEYQCTRCGLGKVDKSGAN